MSDYREESLEEIAKHGEENLLSYIKYLEEQLEIKDELLRDSAGLLKQPEGSGDK